MRAFWACVLLGNLVLALFTCGCGPGSRSDPEGGEISFKRAGWFRLVSPDGKIVGFEEKCNYSSRRDRDVRFVYNTRLVRVGFITPGRVAYRYLDDGSSEKVGLFPVQDQGAECSLLGVRGPLKMLAPGRKFKGQEPTF